MVLDPAPRFRVQAWCRRSPPFWVASAEGSGPQALTWDVQDGSWQVVVMNADGSSNVDTTLSIGAEVPHLLGIGIGALVAGGLALGLAVLLVVLGVRRRS